jgi:hypothetical protein
VTTVLATLRLGRTFDAVLMHDAAMSMATAADLPASIETAFTHLRPGGAVVLFPDFTTATYRPRTEHGVTLDLTGGLYAASSGPSTPIPPTPRW